MEQQPTNQQPTNQQPTKAHIAVSQMFSDSLAREASARIRILELEEALGEAQRRLAEAPAAQDSAAAGLASSQFNQAAQAAAQDALNKAQAEFVTQGSPPG